MDLLLKGKRALVTGSTSGIGWASARELAAEGAHVVLSGRDPARLASAVARIQAEVAGAVVSGVVADLSTAAGCQQLLDGAGELDILVNNLGIFEPKPFEQIGDEDWTRFFEVNVMSGVRLSRHHLPRMKARNWGRIVFISSESGICPPAEMVHYGMSKSAQLSVSRGLAETCIGTGVTVNSVLPGPTRTEGVGDFFATLARDAGQTLEQAEHDFFKFARPTSLLQRFIEPAEIAAMVTYVCSPRSAATNGAALHVEGGVVRSLIY
ncbi:SDR family NAD(P)-dependent oxidoreductase [Simplicispira metamorpha]|uniref:NAD(P)-dependent dehydrogenase (Short-subunit alcohol dehydrogenase family) n=1 Tax=Simplicispira metamorpha TaxID=80881 RepID=A0A4V2SJX3_9BURK|nr:SDR family oxidoreductase [Simplicispira metamorpha]TCP17316.1 NAD(P)-dependent dehydrogenase (short-subunit alcohol dehydrogenase family) [Simplicispira metamorpha]